MQQRYEDRKASAALFGKLVLKNDLQSTASVPITQYQQLAQQNAAERREWLHRFEMEVLIDKVILIPSQLVKGITDTVLEVS